MSVNINVNLKTLNGQSLLGSGNMTINSLNWKGSFASAPLLPAKYDAYHNTTDGSSYIYNGSSWTILAAKGEDGSSSASGMFFPHTTLTNEDVGKMVIWKDGQAQLPVFEPETPATNWKYSYELNLESLLTHHFDQIEISFTSQPNPGDKVKIDSSRTIEFVESSPGWNQCLIGVDLEDTIQNFKDLFSSAIIEDESVIITHRDLMRYGYFSFYGDYFLGAEIEIGSFGTLTNSFVSIVDRLGQSLVPFLFVRAIGFNTIFKPDHFNSFYDSTEFSIVCEQALPTYNLPASLEEMKLGIVDYLLQQESIVSATFNDNILEIESAIELNTELVVDEGDEEFWYNAFDDGEIVTPAGPTIPMHCNYPIVGLVKSVTENQVEIYTEPICRFKSSYIESVEWSNLMDPMRCWVLDPAAPGYLMPLFAQEISSVDTLFTLAAPGYVWSMDNEVQEDSLFTGAFSLDLFPLQVLYLLISEGGD